MRAVREPRLPSANAFSPPQCKCPPGCALPLHCTSRTSLGLQHKDCHDASSIQSSVRVRIKGKGKGWGLKVTET